MNYEKKYKEALEKARQFSERPLEEDSSTIVEYIFPELKESEDERIRKAVIEMIHDTPNIECEENYNVRKEDVIAWLEKQGTSYTKRDVDDAFVEGMAFAKDELEKQCEKPAWSEEDTFKVQRICKYLDEAKKYYADITEVRDCIDWLKSLKQRIGR